MVKKVLRSAEKFLQLLPLSPLLFSPSAKENLAGNYRPSQISCTDFGGGKIPININNFSGLSQERVGVKFVYVLPVSWGNWEKHKQNSEDISGKGRESPGQSRTILKQSRENFVYAFSCLLVSSDPKHFLLF